MEQRFQNENLALSSNFFSEGASGSLNSLGLVKKGNGGNFDVYIFDALHAFVLSQNIYFFQMFKKMLEKVNYGWRWCTGNGMRAAFYLVCATIFSFFFFYVNFVTVEFWESDKQFNT